MEHWGEWSLSMFIKVDISFEQEMRDKQRQEYEEQKRMMMMEEERLMKKKQEEEQKRKEMVSGR